VKEKARREAGLRMINNRFRPLEGVAMNISSLCSAVSGIADNLDNVAAAIGGLGDAIRSRRGEEED
jgi:hypothetical protein